MPPLFLLCLWPVHGLAPGKPGLDRGGLAATDGNESSDCGRSSIGRNSRKKNPIARIQFVHGIDERVLPTVSVTRSLNSRKTMQQEVFFTGTATFWFDRASSLYIDLNKERLITGMFLIDEEGSISTTDVTAKFENGRPVGITSVVVLSSPSEWHRFMRFMERYSDEHGLQFTSANEGRTAR